MRDPFDYVEPVYRPPSEAYSLILQATIGCSHNRCNFCNMYKTKRYHVRPLEEIKEDIDLFRERLGYVRRIFIADGDAVSMPTDTFVEILKHIKSRFPECERISAYASPRATYEKTDEELKRLKDNGLDMVYLGVESGDDDTLAEIRKDVNSQEMLEVGLKLKKAGFILSVTLIAGIKGDGDWTNHAIHSGELISKMKPNYLGVLSLVVSVNTEIFLKRKNGEFKEAENVQILKEIRTIIENINTDKEIIFRANHASNYISLQGTLPQDKERLINEIDVALGIGNFKERRYRRL